MEMHLELLTGVDSRGVKESEVNECVSEVIRRMTEEIKRCVSTRRKSELVFDVPRTSLLLPKEHVGEHVETRWERFARSKGIKKRKKSGLVHDEETGEYIPRYGPYSKKNRELQAAVRDGDVTVSSLRKQRRKNIEKNRANMQANRDRGSR